jgi:predicted lipoprotein with Yx(FWY)xxD motif
VRSERGMRLVGSGLALVLLLAACGSDEPADAGDGSAAAESPAATSEAPIEAASTVQLAETDLGEVLVDEDGLTLYLFEQDEGDASTCYDDCAATWPPLLAEEPTAGEGLDASLLGTTERDGGEVQVTFDGHPLYLFASDAAPGDVEGQGVGDIWFVVDASGAAVTEAARSGAGSGPGY